jgi:hypothetical protein
MFKVLRKADIILLLALCLLGAVLTVWSVRTAAASSSGAEVIITIDGAEYGRYSLDSDRTISIDRNGNHNLVVISDGTVHMEEASCKNQICVHQGIINASGQMIVCLPNGVIAEIRAADGSQAEYDAVSQ